MSTPNEILLTVAGCLISLVIISLMYVRCRSISLFVEFLLLLVDAFSDLHLLKEEDLPELEHELICDFVQDVTYFGEKGVRRALPTG